MNIIAGKKDVFEALVRNFIIFGAPDGELVAELLPVKAVKMASVTFFVYFKKSNRILHRWCKLIKLFRRAVVIWKDSFTFNTIAFVPEPHKALDVLRVLL